MGVQQDLSMLTQKRRGKNLKNFLLNSNMKSFKEERVYWLICELVKYEDLITEAEYEGKKVKLNDPIRTNEVL